jgi:antitoxin PrlF
MSNAYALPLGFIISPKEMKMSALIQERSKLTDRYQTTVPRGVRKQLNLAKGDEIAYSIDANGRVYLEAVRSGNADPALSGFLDLLEADLKTHPERLQAIDHDLRDRIETLVGDVEVDLDALLSPEDE